MDASHPKPKSTEPKIDDADDPGLVGPHVVHRSHRPRGAGMHPMLKVVLILVLLFVLLPFALIVLLFVVCAAVFAV